MILVLFMMIMAFCLVVFMGAVVEALIEMNGWGFLTFLVLFGYYLARKHYPRFKYWKVRNRPTRSARSRKERASAEEQVPSFFPWEKEEDE